jgi:hypothetical protein
MGWRSASSRSWPERSAVLLAVGGCSTEPTPNPTIGVAPAPAQPDTAEQTPAGDPAVDSGVGPMSPRGARPWEVGERMQLWGPPMSAGIGQYVTVTAIKPLDSSCPAAVTKENAKPQHSRFLTIEMTVENTPAYDASQPGYYAGSAQQFDWVSADGTAVNDVANLASFYCTNKMTVFSQMKPGRTYTGFTNVDVPPEAGWLVFGQSQFAGPGFEFEISAA